MEWPETFHAPKRGDGCPTDARGGREETHPRDALRRGEDGLRADVEALRG